MAPVGQVNNSTAAPSSPPQTSKFQENLFKASDFTKKYISKPVTGVAGALGALDYVLPNYFDYETDLLNKSAEWSIKGALVSTSGFGVAQSIIDKNTPGVLGFGLDFLTLFAKHENLFIVRGLGSSIDELPGFLEEMRHVDEVKEAYKLEEGNLDIFNDYSSFGDSASKLGFCLKVICQRIADDFSGYWKKGDYLTAVGSVFSINDSEKHLFVSSLGILTGTLTAIFGKPIEFLKLTGELIRDVFGFHGDIALFMKGKDESKHEKKAGKEDKGDYGYRASGVLYGIGSILDGIYRVKETHNLHSLALAFDRGGALFQALGITDDMSHNANETPSTLAL